MIYTTMKCECCGKIFHSKYWEGGYIDHVSNFVGNMDVYVTKNDIKDMAETIIFSGNNLRDVCYIREFLECFMTWNCFQEDFKNKVKRIVDIMISKIVDAKETAKRVEEACSPLVLALIREDDIDDSYFDLFDDCCEVVKNETDTM